MAKAKQRPRSAPPFRGIDLLDQVYGIADRYPPVLKTCACGSVNFLVPERVHPYCPACRPSDPYEGAIRILEEDLGPAGIVVRLPSKGNRERRFEFFAERWFELDRDSHREPDHVVKGELVARLNKLGKVIPPKAAPMFEHPKPFTEFVQTRTGLVVERACRFEPACNCAAEDMHDGYDWDSIHGLCPAHGMTCVSCGTVAEG